ncbi:MAG: hypothetical protein ABIP75_11875, partial [Pyrinomonadaceae bacterium]
MRLKTSFIVVLAGLITTAVFSAPSSGGRRTHAAGNDADAITGEWNAVLSIQGMSAPVAFKFKVDGNQVTGTADSDHTGHGTLSKGTWADHKINFTLDFTKHESIDVWGWLEDGKLKGEFATEG